jgi:hypothetical protein
MGTETLRNNERLALTQSTGVRYQGNYAIDN